MDNYITAGELAKLACTTKRTIIWYGEKGVLMPKKVLNNGNRLYLEKQVLEYQKILLLTRLGISLDEIHKYLKSRGNLNDLFEHKKILIKKEIDKLSFNLKNMDKYSMNIKNNGTMIEPRIKVINDMKIFYIEKIGSYSKIGIYCDDLAEMFEKKGKKFITMAIFYNPNYSPKKSLMRIGVFADKAMIIKDAYIGVVKSMDFNPGKVISYTHKGSTNILSLFWKEMEKYCALNKIEINKSVPDFEIYHKVSDDETKTETEIFLPIKDE